MTWAFTYLRVAVSVYSDLAIQLVGLLCVFV